MAQLQESFINCQRIGRGNGNSLTNTVFGRCAGRQYGSSSYSSDNVAIGYCAGGGTSVKHNVSIGSFAGRNHRYCNYNVFLGCEAGRHDAGFYAYRSVLIGARTSCSSGAFDMIAIGYRANRYGHYGGASYRGENTIIGFNASPQSSDGTRNVVVGANAFLSNNDSKNTVVGYRVMGVNTTGYYNTAIGDRNHVYSYGASNITSVGFYSYQAYTTSNIGIIGRYAQVNAYVWAAWTTVSDYRDKTDIEYIDDNLSINLIRKLRPVSFRMDYRKAYVNKCGFEFGQKDGTLKQEKETYGFIAQEVKKAAEDLNIILDLVNHEEFQDTFSLTTMNMLPFIVGSIKRLNNEIDDIEKTMLENGYP
jgi:hypothetical protein